MVQDSNRLVIASMVQQLPQAYKAVEIEAMAASRASEFGVEIGIHQAILEGDSTLVVTALAEGDFGAAMYSLFLKKLIIFSLLILNCHTLIQREMTTKSHRVWQN